jgi:serine/threonine protein kinase/Rieske Fe-S protein
MQTLSINQLAGQTLGNYRIERFLGQGRLNAIYLARNLAEEQRLDALTVYRVPERFSPEARMRFLLRFRKEATVITSLEHPHILPVYDHGEVAGNPYLVTPYMMHGSLADLLKRHGKYSHSSILPILEQLVSGLAYAHSKGFIHGTLRPSTIVLSPENALRVAGFGLMHMLQLGGIEPNEQSNTPYVHLVSIAETFLVTPEYVAPEIIQGQSIDIRSDIYALGCILFELLSGYPPFTGKEPLDIINKHVRDVIPLLHVHNPDVPIALTSVVNQALERDPARRFQHVLELIEAFRQASRGAVNYSVPGTVRKTKVLEPTEFLQDDTPRDAYSSNKWQLVPPIVTGKHPTIRVSEQAFVAEMPTQSINTGPWRAAQPTITGQFPAVTTGKVPSVSTFVPQEAMPSLAPKQEAISEMPTQSVNTGPWRAVRPTPAEQSPMMQSGKVPSVSMPASQEAKPSLVPEQNVIAAMPTQSINTGSWRAVRPPAAGQPPMMQSGKVPSVSTSAPQQEYSSFASKEQSSVGSGSQSSNVKSNGEDLSSLVNAYSWWSQPGVALPPKPQIKQTPLDHPELPREFLRLADPDTVKWGDDSSIPYKSAPVSNITSRKVNRRRAVALLATGGVAVAIGAAALNLGMLQHLLGMAPNQAQKQSDTAGKLIPSQANTNGNHQTQGHMGTVIGQTTMALNSANSFKNPADGQGSLLIHLPNNKFVAYEQACTHEQVPVYYNPTTKQLVCPAHGAIFDPANDGAVVQGPAMKPLPSVKISVNDDGTITSG